jgi:tetraacyldisaccharide 4'-kinase
LGQGPETTPRVVSDGKRVLLDSGTSGDEPYMLASNLRGVAVVVDKDRVKGGLHALKELGVDTLLLDDGLQYLHLKHRLDIVLVDRQAPFGNEHLLPRGTLREPPRNLRRASYIFITKCNGESNGELIQRIRQHNRTAEIIECTHKPLYLKHVYREERLPLDYLKGLYIGSLCGIAAPESFEEGLRKLGAKIELSRHFADHHRYAQKELTSFLQRCLRRDVSAVITTEKDAVRLPVLDNLEVPIYFLRVEIEILNGQETWEQCVQRICTPPVMLQPDEFFR